MARATCLPGSRRCRETIGWSYQLLEHAERRLSRPLAVFVCGCTLSAVVAVRSDDDADPLQVLDELAALVGKSWLRQVESSTPDPRYRMLETIREYGLEQLAASGEAETQARRHAEYFRALSEEAEKGLAGPDWRSWRLRLKCRARESARCAGLGTRVGRE